VTGRDLIIYILKNHLEDEPVFKDGVFVGFLTVDDAAEKMCVGPATVSTLTKLGMLDSIWVDGGTYIQADTFPQIAKHLDI